VDAIHAGHLVDLHDVAVHKRRSRAGLLRESLHGPRMPRGILAKHLDGHLPPQRLLLGQIDVPHRAAAQPAQE
jgi:hypothetical protein